MSDSDFLIDGEKVIPNHSFLHAMIQRLLMIPVIIPRFLAFSLILASFEGQNSIIPMSIFVLLYLVLAGTTCYLYKRSRHYTEFRGMFMKRKIFVMILTSIMMPCRVVNPDWNLLSYLSALSAFLISLLLATLALISHVDVDILASPMMYDPELYQQTCGTLIALLLAGPFFTAAQSFLVSLFK